MRLLNIFKSFYLDASKNTRPQTSLELLKVELQDNLDQFNRFQKEAEIGFGKADFFKTKLWDGFNEGEISETHRKTLKKAYELIKRMNEELNIIEIKKNGFISGNISRKSKDEGKSTLENALSYF